MGFSRVAALHLVPFLARITLCAVFVPAGWSKIMDQAEFSGPAAATIRTLTGATPDDAKRAVFGQELSPPSDAARAESEAPLKARKLYGVAVLLHDHQLPYPVAQAWLAAITELVGGGFLLIGFFSGTLTFADVPEMLWSSAKVNGIIVPIIAVALPLAQALTLVQVPQGFADLIRSITDDPNITILLMLGVFILAGCVMEATPNIVILAPIMFPLAQEIGMNDIQFCIFLITSLGVGFITPPLGLNLFVISSVTGQPILSVAARALPYVLSMLLVVLLIAFVPAISTWWM